MSSRPMRAVLRILAVLLVGVVVPTAAVSSSAAASPNGQRRADVASYNLYLGANLQPLFAATPETVAGLAQAVWDHVEQVDFRVRAQAIAPARRPCSRSTTSSRSCSTRWPPAASATGRWP